MFEESKEERTQPREHIKDKKSTHRSHILNEKDDSL